MELFLQLLVVLVLARVFGEAMLRIRQPALVGEILAGVVLALIATLIDSNVPTIALLPTSEAIRLVAEIGVFFLVLHAGIEMQPREIARQSGASLAVAAGGMLLPLASGFALGWAVLPDSPFKLALSLLIGMTLSISAVPVVTKVFMDLNLLHHRVGRTVVSAAIFDDILGLILLAVLTAMMQEGGFPDAVAILLLLAKVALFFVITVVVGSRYHTWTSALLGSARSLSARFTTLLVVGFAFAVLAEALGMHFILGGFMAGLFFEKSRVGEVPYLETKATVERITSGFLAPVFFASIGLHLDLAAVEAVPIFLLVLIAIAVVGKFVGAGLPALLSGLSPREASAVGVGMSGRGVVTIIVASIALRAGLFEYEGAREAVVDNLFSAIVVTAIVTTIAVPVLLRYILPPPDGEPEA